jgi:hypothetical protein
MNEKIRELAKRATTQYSPAYYSEKWTEKFAELIVRECAGIYEAIDNGNQIEGTDNYIEALRKRFGF